MSLLIEQEIPCTHCQYPNEVEVWSAINVKTDPELKDLLLGGEINMAECASCKEIFYAEHFLLYHDPQFELMAFVYPHTYTDERDRWKQKTAEDYAASQSNLPENERLSYPPITLFGLDQLVFLVEDEEENEIQGEIITLYTPGNGFKVRALTHAVARQQNIPRFVPYLETSQAPTRDSVLGALEKIRALNDRLYVYGKFEETLRGNPSWGLAN